MHSPKIAIVLAGLTLAAFRADCAPVENRPVAAPGTQFLQLAEGSIAYDDSGGSGPLVVAIPGMGDLRSEYRRIRPELVRAGYRVVTMDLRGHGESSVPWSNYSAHAVGTDAIALVQQLGAGPAIILGNSFAAGAALWAAHDAPSQVRGVILLGPVLRDLPISWPARVSLWAAFAGPWDVWAWTAYWNSLFPTRKPADQEAVKAALARNLHETGRMAALRAMLQLSKADTTAMLPASRVPALVIMGSKDPDFDDPAAEMQWVIAQIGAQGLLVEGAGHYPHAEMPERITPAVLTFLSGINTPRDPK